MVGCQPEVSLHDSSFGLYRLRSITEQIDFLAAVFGLSGDGAHSFAEKFLADAVLPVGAEGWAALPRWQRVASTYPRAVECALQVIAQTRSFRNLCEGALGRGYLRRRRHAMCLENKLRRMQPNDILIVPVQLTRPWQIVSSCETEFGLGVFATACILLTHPERLVSHGDPCIACPGDRHAPTGGRFSHVVDFILYLGRLGLYSFHRYGAYSRGSVIYGSGYLPRIT